MEDREQRVNLVEAWVLLVGAGVAVTLMGVGAIAQFAGTPGASPTDRALFTVAPGALEGDPSYAIDAGILLLMATPFAGVIALVPGFLWLRRAAFAVASVAVLVLLGASYVIGSIQ